MSLRPEDLPFAKQTATRFAGAIRSTIAERGACSLALSRPTPAEAFRMLAAEDIDWGRVHLFQVDERAAPDGDPERNLTLLREALGDVFERANTHTMPVGDADLEVAARAYAAVLEDVCGSPPVVDVVHLGLGTDGHTASLLPDDPVLEVDDAVVAVTGEAAGYRRLTLTYPVLNRARRVIFVVSGRGKAAALRRLLSRDHAIPAGRIAAQHVEFAIDDQSL